MTMRVFNLHNIPVEVEQIRVCSTSTGFNIGVFRNLDPRGRFTGQYLVLVRERSSRRMLHTLQFHTLATALSTYLDYICRYA